MIFDATVLLQMPKIHFPPCLTECFTTLTAFVRHLILWCVDVSVVFYQTRLRTKALTTIIALEWFLSCVNSFVNLEQRHVGKPLGTEVAGVWKGR